MTDPVDWTDLVEQVGFDAEPGVRLRRSVHAQRLLQGGDGLGLQQRGAARPAVRPGARQLLQPLLQLLDTPRSGSGRQANVMIRPGLGGKSSSLC